MSEDGKQSMKSAQCARIIICISEMFGVSLNTATDIYYNSDMANLIEEGVADLHCRSDKYLAGEVWREYRERCRERKGVSLKTHEDIDKYFDSL